ncbi:hypothetical protein Bca101_026696 [Brassica carinata]
MLAWRPKEKSVTETLCSDSETEQQNVSDEVKMGLELDKTPKTETSFTKNEMGLEEVRRKPIRTEKQATATSEEDKRCGPAQYGLEKPVTLKNRFQLLESNEEEKT